MTNVTDITNIYDFEVAAVAAARETPLLQRVVIQKKNDGRKRKALRKKKLQKLFVAVTF